MQRFSIATISLAISLLFFASIHAETIRVPQDFETIQSAIDNAGAGDSIRVAAGEYVEGIVLDGVRVLLVGNPVNPAAVVINADNEYGSAVTFTGNIRSTTHLNGFTITGGLDVQRLGGGIHCDESSPTLRNLIIEGNTGGSGGGIHVVDGNPPMDNILIQNNESRSYGGGITLMGTASPVMTNITIANNHSRNRGGGLASFSRGRPELEDSEIHDNSSDNSGGGVYTSGVMFLRNVEISNNDCDMIGGGLYCNGNLSFVEGKIINNLAVSAGGAYFDGVEPTLERVLIANNQAQEFGGGLYLSGAVNGRCSPTIVHTTIAENTADEGGAGIYCTDNGNPTLRDCILWNSDGAEISFDEENDVNGLTISYSDVEGGEDGIEINDNGEINWGAGNIDDDPLFVNVEVGDYHLSWVDYPQANDTKSPCIDAGNPNLDEDPDGSRADMGVYWFQQTYPIIEVSPLALAFGSIVVGEERELSMSIRNVGEIDLIGSIRIEQEFDAFRFDEQYSDFQIEPGEGISVSVFFRAGEEQNYSGILFVNSNDPDNPTIEAELSGQRLVLGPPVIEVSPIVIAFGSIAVGEERELSMSIRNLGETVLTGSIRIEQEFDAFRFDEQYSDFQIEPGEDISVSVFYRAGIEQDYSGVLYINSNDPNDPTVEAELTGGRLNQGPQIRNRIRDFSIVEDAEPAVIANLNDVFFDNDGDSLTFTVSSDELNVSIEANGDFILSPPQDYNGERNRVQIIASDNWEGMIPLEESTLTFYVEVLPMNDPPETFYLREPSASEILDTWDVEFVWDVATQNEWELDEVTYTLELMRNDSTVSIDSLTDNWQAVQLGAVLDVLGRDEGRDNTELTWHVLAVDDSAQTMCYREFSLFVPNQLSISNDEEVPVEFSLDGIYPNPFNSTTTVAFSLPVAVNASVNVYDMSGRVAARLMNGIMPAGRYSVSWQAENLPAGVYTVVVDASGMILREKVVLVK